jgi:hypothetical protein
MWKLPDGKTIASPRSVTVGDTVYPADIFRRWSKIDLASIGIVPFREVTFDTQHYRSTGSEDVLTDGEIVRRHTTTKRFTNQELRVRIKRQLKSTLRKSLSYACLEIGYLVEFEPDNQEDKDMWIEYISDLRFAANIIRSRVRELSSYDEAVMFMRSCLLDIIPPRPDADDEEVLTTSGEEPPE